MAYVKKSQRNYGEEFTTNQNELVFLLETLTSKMFNKQSLFDSLALLWLTDSQMVFFS